MLYRLAESERFAMSKAKHMSSKPSKGTSLFKRFLSNAKGSLTPMFGLAAIPFMLAAGAAIDMSRVTREQAALAQAIDSAALAVAVDARASIQGLTASKREQNRVKLEKYAKLYLERNYKDISGGEASLDVKLKIRDSEVELRATLDLPMTFMKLGGIDNVKLNEMALVKKPSNGIELSMVLDTTGSMSSDMNALKTASRSLLDELYGGTLSNKPENKSIRIALVPFSAAVRLDTTAYDFSLNWIDTTGANPLSKINFSDTSWNNYTAWSKLKKDSSTFHQWNGCVESRKYGTGAANLITTDDAPQATYPDTLFPAFFNPDSPSWRSGSPPSNGKAYWPNSTFTAYSSSTQNVNNNYIDAKADWLAAAEPSLAPNGADDTGYDDSVIGNQNASMTDRFKNTAKYEDKVIGAESPSSYGPWFNCTSSRVVPMTHQRAKIEAGITAMAARGNTNIAEGAAWGMRTISPGAPFTKVEGTSTIPNDVIAPYKDSKWKKVVVLMSDGENYACAGCYRDTGTSYNSLGAQSTSLSGGLNRYGSTSSSDVTTIMDTNTKEVCSRLKGQEVVIYSIAFRMHSPVLEDCATTKTKHYKRADDQAALLKLFKEIGAEIREDMLYVAK
jgi:hypothetical protein